MLVKRIYVKFTSTVRMMRRVHVDKSYRYARTHERSPVSKISVFFSCSSLIFFLITVRDAAYNIYFHVIGLLLLFLMLWSGVHPPCCRFCCTYICVFLFSVVGFKMRVLILTCAFYCLQMLY